MIPWDFSFIYLLSSNPVQNKIAKNGIRQLINSSINCLYTKSLKKTWEDSGPYGVTDVVREGVCSEGVRKEDGYAATRKSTGIIFSSVFKSTDQSAPEACTFHHLPTLNIEY